MTSIQPVKIGENVVSIEASVTGAVDLTADDNNYMTFIVRGFNANGKELINKPVTFTKAQVDTFMATNPTPEQIQQAVEDRAVTQWGLTKV